MAKKVGKRFDLNFSLLPDLRVAPLCMTIDWLSPGYGAKNPLTELPETYDRADAAVKFCWFVGGPAERLCCKEDDTMTTRQAFLRAALSEFASMEEALKRDLVSIGIKDRCMKITDSRNPLLHIVKQLRNLEIHLRSGAISSQRQRALLQNLKKPESVSEQNLTIWVMDDLTTEQFDNLRGAHLYRENDRNELISWFNQAQKAWGLDEIVFRAVLSFGQELIERYSLA